HINGQLVLNPSNAELATSKLDLVVAGTESAVLMVESEAEVLSEEEMLSAVVFGHDQQQTVIKAINEFAAEVATPAWDWEAPAENTELKAKIAELAESQLVEAYQITEKMARYDRIHEISAEVSAKLLAEDEELNPKEIHTIFHDL
ncbi:polyribonucleotide nucleotidyltransferase, partial [Vibrio parahaemolyticus]|nr:polyribonucleotide nucleotidyltransferase [Vibrio parahaemolyticus]